MALFPLAPTDASFLFKGRVDVSGTRPSLQWPQTSVSVQLDCPMRAVATFRFTSAEKHSTWRLLLDGASNASQPAGAGSTKLSMRVPPGSHTLELLKDSECLRCSPAMHAPPFHPIAGQPETFDGLSVSDPNCRPSRPTRQQRRVEVVGDSIACGFGNQVTGTVAEAAKCQLASATAIVSGPGEWLYEHSSAHDSFAGVLSRSFGAELSLQCISGIGVCKDGLGMKAASPYNISNYVDATLPFVDGADAWDYSRWAPHLLVFNVGTNECCAARAEPGPSLHLCALLSGALARSYDTSVGKMAPSQTQFQDAYVSLVRRLAARYAPAPPVLLACGPMTDKQCPFVQNATAQLNALGLKAEYVHHVLPNKTHGCAGHPDKAEAAELAKQLEAAVRSLTGWP
jgi:hypothetical protein